MLRIALLDDYQSVGVGSADWSSIPDASVFSIREHIRDPDELVGALASSSVVVLMRERTPFDAAILDRLPNLELIVTTGMTNAALDVHAATERGITVCGTRAIGTNATELTWALILGLARQLPAEDANVRRGGWQRYVGHDLHGATLGVLGLGRIGSAVAAIGPAFGMRTIAWSPNLTPQVAADRGAEWVDKDGLFSEADVLTVHLVLSDRSAGLVGAREFRTMKRTALFVNTSRAGIVDTAALVDALQRAAIGGAALDVFDEEPLPLHDPLRRCPNLILSPHIGYVTERCYSIFYKDAVKDILAWRDGDPIRRLE